MFDSRLTYHQVKDKFRWQTSMKLEVESLVKDSIVIKEHISKYGAFFWKVIKGSKMRFILLYFNNEFDLLVALEKSVRTETTGNGLQLKK
ncbi:uncharacterized protein OCT59_023776 [Rhizophagus irregularis]|uniref:uncharacterized protein n=1 Tax=Rhizophagus irregularis TaxID=588596 RepID=UPI00332DC39C|nr:hypothetical protein OCT59_023776 [Rhizophagus irregularis]